MVSLEKTAKYGFGIGIVIVLLPVLPYVILGQNSYVTIHDNLDSQIIYYRVLVQSGQVFEVHSDLDQIMNGIPRECFPTGLSFVAWLFLLLEPFTAYVVNKAFVHLIAFIGMYVLLKTHLLHDKKDAFVVLGSSICFGVLPFYSIFGLSIAGQPLLLYAFLNLLK